MGRFRSAPVLSLIRHFLLPLIAITVMNILHYIEPIVADKSQLGCFYQIFWEHPGIGEKFQPTRLEPIRKCPKEICMVD